MSGILNKEDYMEPACPLCNSGGKDDIHPIDIGRAIEKLDEHLARNDYASAEKHLLFWVDEARFNADDRGLLALYNELMGLYRKTYKRDNATAYAEKALDLVEKLGLSDSSVGGTTLVNAATVYKAFSMPEKAIQLYRKALEIYKASLPENDPRLGGLFNNMGLAYADLAMFDDAEDCYKKALSVMQSVELGELEQAITYLNMADLENSMLGTLEAEEAISKYVEKAIKLLDAEILPRNGYYAFVLEKCVPTIRYYGYFLDADRLEKTYKGIYERA